MSGSYNIGSYVTNLFVEVGYMSRHGLTMNLWTRSREY